MAEWVKFVTNALLVPVSWYIRHEQVVTTLVFAFLKVVIALLVILLIVRIVRLCNNLVVI